jgi:hypothetical protein
MAKKIWIVHENHDHQEGRGPSIPAGAFLDEAMARAAAKGADNVMGYPQDALVISVPLFETAGAFKRRKH